ncbi:MAG: hypothetical protein QHH06_07165 [Clostridiales bacterium]|nr:hypothetical protein [Eubacteriales bacterium]MDH7566247.1 hypothetical protein [Clostridiales bacterium]
MPDIIYEVFIYLLAVYGALTLIISVFSSIYRRSKPENGNVKLVLAVKNQQETVEGMVRSIFKSDLLHRLVPDNTLTVLDMGSTDETLKILSTLKKEYEYIDIIKQEEKERVFNGFETV